MKDPPHDPAHAPMRNCAPELAGHETHDVFPASVWYWSTGQSVHSVWASPTAHVPRRHEEQLVAFSEADIVPSPHRLQCVASFTACVRVEG